MFRISDHELVHLFAGSTTLGAASLFIAGFIASLCVSWYDVSSREGASGFFVIYMALFGGIIGAVIGLIVARQTVGYAGPGFWKELPASLGVILVIAGIITLVCRLFADVPPTIDGARTDVTVEFRFPDTIESATEPTSTGNWQFTFSSLAQVMKVGEPKKQDLA